MRPLGRALPALLALSVLAGCGKTRLAFPRAPVILITIDTLRADHLPAYGYGGVETPNLEGLRKESVVFENALAPVPLTLPSHTSLFTGLLPFQHGVRDNIGYRLSPGIPTLAGFLRDRGYATGGAVSAFVLQHGTGIARGFDFYQDGVEMLDVGEALGQVQRAGSGTEKLIEKWMEAQPAGKPVFAFLHLYEPHTPYDPPEPFKSRYLRRPYDGEIAAADAIVGQFLAFLKSKAIYDRAIIILLSDHGEGLGDHGEDEHGIFLYREVLRIPLFVKLPGGARGGERVSAPAGIVDVFPTLAALLGEKTTFKFSGAALLSAGSSPSATRRLYSETLYPRFHFGWSDLASLTDDRYQYIEAPKPELYDWTSDAGEKKDLASGLPPPFRSMRAQLQAMERPLQTPGASDAETVRKLASLGYIGTASSTTGVKDLPDPKDRIQTVGQFKEASHLIALHREDEAVSLLRRLAGENPRMLEVWELLARTLRHSGRPIEALEALERADRLQPGTPQILIGLADVCLENNDLKKARSLAEAARVAGATDASQELAQIALAAGDLNLARREAREGLSERSSERGPWVLQAEIEAKAGNLPGAVAALDRADALGRSASSPPILNLEATRGDVLARMGEEKKAETAFAAEIQNFPENLDAWSRLALLYASAGRRAEFRELLSRMTSQVPGRRSLESAAHVCEVVGDKRGARIWRERAGSS